MDLLGKECLAAHAPHPTQEVRKGTLQVSERLQLCDTFILDFCPPEVQKMHCTFFKPHGVWSFVTASVADSHFQAMAIPSWGPSAGQAAVGGRQLGCLRKLWPSSLAHAWRGLWNAAAALCELEGTALPSRERVQAENLVPPGPG